MEVAWSPEFIRFLAARLFFVNAIAAACEAGRRRRDAVRMGEGQPIEQAIAIVMEAHWRSAVHPDRLEGIGAFNEGREPSFADPDY